jgi:hypothetical protein
MSNARVKAAAVWVGILLAGCDATSEAARRFSNPVFLFDGESVVFDLGNIDGENCLIQLRPHSELDEQGAIIGRTSYAVILVTRSNGRFTPITELLAGSEKERAVIERLNKLRAYYADDHFWRPRVDRLADLIVRRSGPPPDASYWSTKVIQSSQ